MSIQSLQPTAAALLVWRSFSSLSAAGGVGAGVMHGGSLHDRGCCLCSDSGEPSAPATCPRPISCTPTAANASATPSNARCMGRSIASLREALEK
jgi:hypothetical protein